MASRTKASRSAAAKKAAATRKRNASKRSAAAKKAAATRKRNAKGAKKTAAKRSTKASRSAAAKKAAATRKRNASKRSAAAKKAAATRKRNARKSPAKRKSSKRGTAASRSRAAKKAAATRKRNAAKRSRAAKKAAATRKSKGRRSSVKSKSRPTASKRRAAAKKAAATRKRNAAKRSRAAKKAAATRKRNSRGKRKPSRRSSKASTAPATMKMGKTLTDAFMAPFNSIPSLATTAAVAAAVGGLYMVVKPRAWDAFGLTGQGGYINQAAQMLPVLPANVKDDLGNLGNKLLDAGTIAGLTYVLSSKKALNILDPKIGTFVAVLAGLNSVEQFLSQAQTLNIGGAYSNLKSGDFGNVFNQLGAPTTTSPTYGTLGAAHPMGMMHGAHPMGMMHGAHNNMGMMHGAHNNMGMMHGAHNYSMGMAKAPGKQGFFGAHNGAVPMGNNTIMNTAATRGTHAGNAIFGSKGMGRVNLF